jgi:hypothetical protein
MKKSEIYRLAQGAVVTNTSLPTSTKLEILRELMDKEDVEKFCEKRAEKEAQATEEVKA